MKIKHKFNPDKTFFTSDQHLFHKHCIEYTNRPYKDEVEMTEALITNWNSVVPIDGDVIDAGDMMFTGSVELIKETAGRLNGRIWRCLGNHDMRNRHDRQSVIDIFEGRVYDVISIDIEDNNFFVSHYPHAAWPRESYMLHGHIHSGPFSVDAEIIPYHHKRFDIGCDNNNYFPVSYRTLIEMFNKRKEDEINKEE